jgi:hypothetical protein
MRDSGDDRISRPEQAERAGLRGLSRRLGLVRAGHALEASDLGDHFLRLALLDHACLERLEEDELARGLVGVEQQVDEIYVLVLNLGRFSERHLSILLNRAAGETR